MSGPRQVPPGEPTGSGAGPSGPTDPVSVIESALGLLRGGHAALRMLAGLAASGPSSISELADAIGVDQPRASRLAKSAIDAGHVRREVDPGDARRSILVLTDAGRAALTATLGRRRAAVETALEGFTDAERAEFARLLARFVEAWPRP